MGLAGTAPSHTAGLPGRAWRRSRRFWGAKAMAAAVAAEVAGTLVAAATWLVVATTWLGVAATWLGTAATWPEGGAGADSAESRCSRWPRWGPPRSPSSRRRWGRTCSRASSPRCTGGGRARSAARRCPP
jgi:hypothetical protein